MMHVHRALSRMAVVITAAGFSGRMGKPKVALVCRSQETFAEKIIQTYLDAGTAKVVLVVNAEGKTALEQKKVSFNNHKVSVVLNAYPEKERFFSLQTGLKQLTGFRGVFIQNIDNPFVSAEVLFQLAEKLPEADYVVPQFHGRGGHPVLLSSRVAGLLASHPDYTENLRRFLQNYRKVICPVEDEKILVNINTPEIYHRYFPGNVL